MNKLLVLLLFPLVLLAGLSQEVKESFSSDERKTLLTELDSYPNTIHKTKTYTLSKGWNLLTTPVEGVDVVSTFTTSGVTLVAVYDTYAKVWATFSQKKSTMNDKTITLKHLEPNISFFVLASKDIQVTIQSININKSCQKLMDDPQYSFMIHSGLEKTSRFNATGDISIESRYLSHYEKGHYTDTRVVLIYPNIETKTKAKYNYGPASPKTTLKYAKEYKEMEFYIYDYRDDSCYMGLFPSMKIPPFPNLKKI